MTRALYIHGFASQGDSARVTQLLDCGFRDAYAPDFFLSAQDNLELVRKMAPESLCFVGTSLGGFYAALFGAIFKRPAIAFNPVPAARYMERRLGEHRNLKTGESFLWTQAHHDALAELEARAGSPLAQRSDLLIFSGRKDDIVPSSALLALNADTHLIDAGHRIPELHPYLGQGIGRDFLQAQRH